MKLSLPLLFLSALSLFAESKKPNFLFVITDDQRWDAIASIQKEQGDKARFPWLKTPSLDRLKSESATFRNVADSDFRRSSEGVFNHGKRALSPCSFWMEAMASQRWSSVMTKRKLGFFDSAKRDKAERKRSGRDSFMRSQVIRPRWRVL